MSIGESHSHLLRRRYLSRLALRYKRAFRPHRELGQTLGNKRNPEIWRNVAQHCLVAGCFAELLAQEMRLASSQVRDVTEAAILHDWYKKHETLARRRASSPAELIELVRLSNDEDRAALRNYGVSEKVLDLCRANLPETVLGPQTDEEKIVWFVDAMLADTEPVSIEQRFADLEGHPSRGAANLAFSASYFPRYGKTLYELQRELGRSVGDYLARRIGFDGDSAQLPRHLNDVLSRRIADSEKEPASEDAGRLQPGS